MINKVILAPWHCNICSAPTKDKKVAIKNLRIIASFLYHSARLVDPQLPEVKVEFKEVIVKKDVPIEAVAPSPEDASIAIDIKDAKPSEESKNTKGFYSNMLSAFTSLFYVESSVSSVDANHLYAEETMLGEKNFRYESMQNLHNLLLPLEYFASKDSNRALFTSICREIKSKLSIWLTKMCIVSITYKIREKESRGGDGTIAPDSGRKKLSRQSASRSDVSPLKERISDPSLAPHTSRSRVKTAGGLLA